MAKKFYGAIGVSGGSDGFLDNIDGTNLADTDGAWVIDSNPLLSVYHLDFDSAASQVVPTIITPDANASDRRWLLTGLQTTQMKLYEAGTTNLVNISQSSGNLVIDNTYDTGTITFKGENTGDTTMLVMDPAGSVELYEAGVKKLETSATGVTITGVSASTTSTSGTYDATTDFTVGDLVITDGVITDATGISMAGDVDCTGAHSATTYDADTDFTVGSTVLTDGVLTDSTGFQITGGTLTVSGSAETMATFTDDGSVDLYYDNLRVFRTTAAGIDIFDTDGDDTILNFKDNSSNTVGSINIENDSMVIYTGHQNSAESFFVTGWDGVDTFDTLIQAQQGGSVTLYYDGTRTLTTGTSGASLYGTSGTDVTFSLFDASDALKGQLFSTSGAMYIDNNVHGGEVVLQAENTSGTAKYVYLDPDVPSFEPGSNNDLSLGTDAREWKDVWATDTSINSSDGRYKRDIIDTPLGLDFISDLRPVFFKWKDTPEIKYKRHHGGFIAQEVKETMDKHDVDFGLFVVGENTGKMHLRYTELIAPLVKAVQELRAELDILKKEKK